MTILTLNVGSTSIKYSVFVDSKFVLSGKTEDVLDLITKNRVDVVINRIVFGGDSEELIKVDDKSIEYIGSLNRFAPLHNPPALEVIKKIKGYDNKLEQKIEQYMVFDTTFHQTIADYRRNYALPIELIKELKIYKYGFHGLSHSYLASQLRGKKRVITLHLGGGSSVCAIKDGKSVACSMGFGPEEGLIMVSRTGDIGASALLDIMETKNLDINQARELVFKQSGLLGLTGTKEVKDIMTIDKPEYILAREMFVNKIVDTIGAYYLLLGGLDALVFSGGIGENSDVLRQLVVSKLNIIGGQINPELNIINSEVISTKDSKFIIKVIEAREDLSMFEVFRSKK
jgi:acetate kinase